MSKKNRKERIAESQEKKFKVAAASFDPAADSKLKRKLGLFIGIFFFFLYAQTISFTYTYDDFTVISENRVVKQGIQGIPDILTSDYWYGFKEGPDSEKSGLIYRPASLVMFALEWQLMPNTPELNHFFNVLLYALTCILVFMLLCRIFKNYSLIVPFVCAALFTIHPIHTEVVSNIKSRDEILCLLFGIGAAINFLKFYTDSNKRALIFGSLLFFLSLLSKETGVTWFACIPLLLFVARGWNGKKMGISLGILLLFAGAYFLIRSQINIGVSTVGQISMFDNIMANATDLSSRLGTAFYIMGRYLLLLFIPHPLVSDYSYSQLELKTFGSPEALISILIHIAAGLYALFTIRKQNIIAFGIFFYFITLFPVSNILFLIGSNMAERFLYTPSFGFCIVFIMLLLKLAKGNYAKASFSNMNQFFSKYSTLLLIAGIFFIGYTIKTLTRSGDWKNNISLFGADVKNSPRSSRIRYGYGSSLIMSIDSTKLSFPEIDALMEAGKTELEAAIAVWPEYANAHFTIGAIYKDRKNYPTAVSYMENAIKYYPGPNPVYYKSIGYAYLKNGQFDRAINALDTFMLLDKPTWEIYNNKGTALFGQAKYNDALQVYLKADSLNRNDSVITKNIGRAYAYMQQYDQAEVYFRKAIQLEPNNSATYRFLAFTFQFRQDTARANEYFRQADAIDAGLPGK